MLRQLSISCMALVTLATSQYVHADVRLPKIFGDHMVIQQKEPTAIWGWAESGEKVTVTFGKEQSEIVAGADGKWSVRLDPPAAGGPYEMTVKSEKNAVTFKDVLVGEVWLCSGQSNMEWRLAASKDAKEEIAAADYPKIRHVKIPHSPGVKPQDDVNNGGWQVCSPKTAGGFTGVGYFFGRHLHKELNVPIGLIGSNWGGTRIEPWTPPVGFAKVAELKSIHEKIDTFPATNKGKANHQSPLALYNGMIHPLVPYTIKGAIWYQGESNKDDGMLYHHKMRALIEGWRSVWKNDEMPFYFVQLAPFDYRVEGTRLAKLWEAQTETLKVPHTGMAVTVDIGNVKDIHPRNKQDVGKRLALWALAKDYGQDSLVYSGPLFKEMKVEGDKIRVSFDHVGGGLTTRDGKAPNWFQVAGSDKKFVEAKAEIAGKAVIVSAEGVKSPVAVRFAFDQKAEPNLCNEEGLPASPFRTDKD